MNSEIETKLDDLRYHIKFLKAGINLRSKEEQERDLKEIESVRNQIKTLNEEKEKILLEDRKIQLANFKKDLKSLLSKYNASINFVCDDCSDTYGIYEEGIAVSFDQFHGDNDYRLSDGYGVDESDL